MARPLCEPIVLLALLETYKSQVETLSFFLGWRLRAAVEPT